MNSDDFKKLSKTLLKKMVNIENTECVICSEEIKVGTLILPCMHYQYCMCCVATSMITECSLCRQPIKHMVHYYKNDDYGKNVNAIAEAINFDTRLK